MLNRKQAVIIYNDLCQDLEKIETGTWREDDDLSHRTIEEIETMRMLVALAEERGLGEIARKMN